MGKTHINLIAGNIEDLKDALAIIVVAHGAWNESS